MSNLRKYSRWDTAICIAVALLAAWTTARHPYAYYTMVRWAVCLTGVYMAWRLYKSNMMGLAILFGGTAILFNPIAPFYLKRGTWEGFDLICAGVFLLGAILTPKLRPMNME